MKFLCIVLALSIAFIYLHVLDSFKTQIQNYETFEDFLAEIENTANSLFGYVIMIQTLFCPDQPVRGAVLERRDDFVTLPAVLTVANLTVKLETSTFSLMSVAFHVPAPISVGKMTTVVRQRTVPQQKQVCQFICILWRHIL